MNRTGKKGSITVFLSLSCILFLSLICAVVESARVQGAKAQTANITGMGTFSLLGEFEKEFLEKYDIFSLDGAYGSGTFQISKVNERLQDYISYNANPKKDLVSLWCFDPWNLALSDSSISGYTLLTDEQGEPFYQQAVSFMKANTAVIAVDKLLEYSKNVSEIQKRQEEYEESQRSSDQLMDGLEKEKEEKLQEMEATDSGAAAPNGEAIQGQMVPSQVQVANPLIEIAKIRRKSVLDLFTWDKTISQKAISGNGLPSVKTNRKGNLKVIKTHRGLTADVLFREYLMMHFSSFVREHSDELLDYEVEYIIAGKKSDKDNLKYVVNRLLLMREGMNYLYCVQEPKISWEAEKLAIGLTGIFGIPALTAATKHALLLAWAYGESLVDVRILLDKGKVPLYKNASSWSLSLENLGRITEVLQAGAEKDTEGLRYDEYLRILLNMGKTSVQKMRGLDLIQTDIQKNGDNKGFKAENCIVAVKAETKWDCKPVFYSLPQIVFGTSFGDVTAVQESSIAY